MTTRLEAEVIDVKPNGTLVLQARRHMQIDEETISVTLTGLCRVQDVDATNSMLSTDMHDLNLKKITTGQVRDTTKRGLLHQAVGPARRVLRRGDESRVASDGPKGSERLAARRSPVATCHFPH